MLDFNYIFWALLIIFIIVSHIAMARYCLRKLSIELADGFIRLEGRAIHAVLAAYAVINTSYFTFVLLRKSYYLAFIL